MDDFPVIKFESVNSTNSYLKNLVKEGRLLKGAVYALSQTKGRGRGSNTWISPVGGVYVSVAYPVENAEKLALIGPKASLKIVDWLKNRFDINAEIKWPNDILVNECKLAGFLMETVLLPDNSFVLIVGFGMNLNKTPKIKQKDAFKPISISEITGKKYNVDEISSEIINIISDAFSVKPSEKERLIENLKSKSATLGKKVKISTSNTDFIEGKAVDINENFKLLVETNGILAEIEAGDCFHVRESQNTNTSSNIETNKNKENK